MNSRPIAVAHLGYLRPDSCDGVAQTILGIVKHLPPTEIAAEVWEFTTKAKCVEEAFTFGVKLVRLPAYSQTLLHMFHVPATTHRFLQDARTRIDLLHTHSVFRVDNLWASRPGIPYIHTPNGGYSPHVLYGRNRVIKRIWISLWERGLWNAAAALHAVSHREAQELRALAPGRHVRIIPNGVDEALLLRPREVERSGPYWIFMGRMAIEQKGLDLLLAAYALAQKDETLPDLLLVGPDVHGSKNILRRLASSLGIGNCVQLIEPIQGDAKYKLVARARALLQPSRWEGLPFSVLEALALAVPVMATPETGFCESIAEADAGWPCQGNIESIAATMRAMARSSHAELERKSSHARGLARTRYSWKASARHMAELYMQTLRPPA